MKRKFILMILFFSIILTACSSKPSQKTIATYSNAPILIKKAQDTKTIICEHKNSSNMPNNLYEKENLPDGIYLISNDMFEALPTVCPGIKPSYRFIIDFNDTEWFQVKPGAQFAFKGNFSPNQTISLERSVSDCYSFPNFISYTDNKHLAISTSEKGNYLYAETITVNGTEYPINIVCKEENFDNYNVIDNLNWKISSHVGVHPDISSGYFLNGNFPKGFSAEFGGYQGTNYLSFETSATCHIIEMPDDFPSYDDYKMSIYLETTKNGYFTMTIPEDAKPGFYSLYANCGWDSLNCYFQIQ